MIFINIGIAFLGLGATLSAFGGDTWRKGSTSLISRITFRGWISLVCLVCVFSLGVYKEIQQRRESEEKEVQRVALANENRQQREKITNLQSQIDESARGIKQSAESLSDTTEEIGEQQLASIEAAFKLAIKIPRETDSSQGQSEFRKRVLTSPFSEFAKRIYKATTADILNLRSNPDPRGQIISRLEKGSFVRILQEADKWTEVMTPEGRQGWVASEFLGQIKQ
jgi:hypothetical protein